jgi:hypothetical protein
MNKTALTSGTMVTWKSGTEAGGKRTVLSFGVIESYGYYDMPWKLYQIREEGTGRIAFVHPGNINHVQVAR